MALVEEHQRVGRHVVHQRGRRLAGRCARQMAAVVLDALAVAHLLHHLQVEAGALLQALGFHQLAVAHKLGHPLAQFQLDGFHRRQHPFTRGHIVALGVDDKARDLLPHPAGQRVQQAQGLDLVVEQLHPQRQFTVLGREDVDGVAAHPKAAAAEVDVVAAVLHADQLRDHVALADLVAHPGDETHLGVVLGLADAVDGTDRGHDHRVAPLQHALGGRQAHLLDVLVDRAVLLDEQVALRHIGLGLVVVVVADEILHRVARKELAELGVQLRGQGLVGRKHDRRTAHAGDHIGHGEGLARAGHAQQGLVGQAVVDAFTQQADGLGLVAGRRVGLEQLERRIGVADERALCRQGHQVGRHFSQWGQGSKVRHVQILQQRARGPKICGFDASRQRDKQPDRVAQLAISGPLAGPVPCPAAALPTTTPHQDPTPCRFFPPSNWPRVTPSSA